MFNIIKHSSKPKVFCIGHGKTGTTSVEKALRDLKFKIGDQVKGELLLDAYVKRDFKAIIKFCKTAEAFQDAPFCFKFTFMALDIAYPDSKFILTIRDSPNQWYESLCNFHSKLYGDNGNLPTVSDLKNTTYRYKGYAWDVRRFVYGMDEHSNPYDKETLINYYTSHNENIQDYFKNKDNLLVINVAEKDAYKKMCTFLQVKPLYNDFPWENKTSELK